MKTTTTDEALILTGTGYELQISPSAEEQKAELLKHSALIVEVKDISASDAARTQLTKLGKMRNLIEASRKKVKEPVLKVGTDIDAKAKAFGLEILAEEERLKKLMADYATEVAQERARVQREIEQKRREEEQKRQEEEAEQRRIAAEAEKKRQEAEDAAWNATTPEEEAAAARKAQEAEQKLQEAITAPAPAPVVTAPTFVPAAPKGVKFVTDYEVINIHKLYQAAPSVVSLEARRTETLAWIKQQQAEGIDTATLAETSGIRVFERPAVNAR